MGQAPAEARGRNGASRRPWAASREGGFDRENRDSAASRWQRTAATLRGRWRWAWLVLGLVVIWAPAATLYAIRSWPRDAAATRSGNSPPASVVASAYVPTFETSLGDVAAGGIAVVTLDECATPVAISALHLLGPSGGLSRQVEPEVLGRVVRTLTIDRIDLGSEPLTIPARAIPMPNTAPLGKKSRDGDVVAFWVDASTGNADASALQPLRLATTTPAPGERVWLLAFADTTSEESMLHPATVEARNDDGLLWYRFKDPSITLNGTSGAAMLNAAGEVVAINLAGAKDGKAALGCGNPVTRFGPALREAVRKGCNDENRGRPEA